MRTLPRLLVPIAILSLLTACAGTSASPTAMPPESETPPSASEQASASAEADGCAAENLETKAEGRLTIGTDNPAFPPYYDPPAEGETPTDPWELGDPTNGRGFESAVAYAVAGELGFAEDDVDWIAVPFDNSFAPGEKEFDFYLAQVSYAPEREEGADLSDGYFFSNQALVAQAGSEIEGATTIAEVAEFRLGVAQNTTSLAYIEEQIQPSAEPMVYNTNDAALAALNAGQVDGIVVDVPTAFFMRDAQMDNGVIVGQFPSAGEQEHFSLVLELDSPLTDCVNEALAALTDSGELESITEEWMSASAGAPLIGE